MEAIGKPTKLKHIPPKEMTKEQLLHRVGQLEKHVFNLRNVIAKSQTGETEQQHRYPKQKPLNFNRYNTRHVALKVAYLGWHYQGYAVQEDNVNTIEHQLFQALLKAKLIQAREVSNYHRCGRTDKGVSAFSQVVSISLRTNLLEGRGVIVREGGTAHERQGGHTQEIAYCTILNRLLPQDIRVLAWSPVDPDFSARFSCYERTYKYFFPKADLNISAMQEAGSKMVGSHDFRNICKMDVGNGVYEYIRRIQDVRINCMSDRTDDPYALWELTIVGNAFLWHQIRCVVAVMFMVGEGKESPQIVDVLLDVESTPRKPQYQMASELPLILFDCQFENMDWITDEESQIQNLKTLQMLSTECSIKSAIVKSLLGEVEKMMVTDKNGDKKVWSDMNLPIYHQVFALNQDSKARYHKPLMERILCESLDDRMKYFAKRRKIATVQDDSSQMNSDSDEDSDLQITKLNTADPCSLCDSDEGNYLHGAQLSTVQQPTLCDSDKESELLNALGATKEPTVCDNNGRHNTQQNIGHESSKMTS